MRHEWLGDTEHAAGVTAERRDLAEAAATMKRPEDNVRPWGRWLAIVPMLIALNLALGAPLLCQLHCLGLPGGHEQHERIGAGFASGLTSIGTLTASTAAPGAGERGADTSSTARLHCPDREPASSQNAISATYELADLFDGFVGQTLLPSATARTRAATLISLAIAPPERPPSAPIAS